MPEISKSALRSFGRMARTAKSLRVPRDQFENFVRGEYVAQPKQLAFHSACRRCDLDGEITEVGIGGARGGAKSHALFAQITLDDMVRCPGLHVLLMRKSGKAMRELADHFRPRIIPKWRTPHTHSRSTGRITYPNGSILQLGHYQTDRAIEDYTGLAYDLIGIEEATTLATEKHKLIRTCLRTDRADWRPRVYTSANPGGASHAYYRNRFVLGRDPTCCFVEATYKDNRFLNPDYVKQLEALTGWRRKAWLLGDWSVFAGMYFTPWDESVHVVKPHPVKNLGWTFYLGADFGWAHPTAWLLVAQDNQGDLVVIDGTAKVRTLPEAHHKRVLRMLSKWGLSQGDVRAFILGTDAWKKNERGVAAVDSYKKLGWNPKQAKMSRITGAMEVLQRLGDKEAGIPSTLRVFDNTTGLIDQMPTLQHDSNNPEDVRKVGADEDGTGGDDYYDVLRYLLMELAKPQEISFGTLSIPR